MAIYRIGLIVAILLAVASASAQAQSGNEKSKVIEKEDIEKSKITIDMDKGKFKLPSSAPVQMAPQLLKNESGFTTRQAPMGGALDATRVQYLEALMDDMKLKFASLTDTIKAQNEVIRTQEAQLKELDTRIKELRTRLDKVDKGRK